MKVLSNQIKTKAGDRERNGAYDLKNSVVFWKQSSCKKKRSQMKKDISWGDYFKSTRKKSVR